MAYGLGEAVSGLLGITNTAINNRIGRDREREARYENYTLNEVAAQHADERTRRLYNDIYSPAALMEQYKQAGLSPSLMFSGTPGQGGMSGAQGAGVNQPSTYMPMDILQSMLVGSQIEQMQAQTDKIKSETKNINQDTALKEIQTKFQELATTQYESEWKLLNTTMTHDDGSPYSLFEMADNCYSYDMFMKKAREAAERADNTEAIDIMGTEAGQKQMRSIYEASSRFHRDIAVLTSEEVNASFQQSIITELSKDNYKFAQLNAEAAVKQLQASIQTDELTREQKESWNRLIDRLGKNGSTTKDIVVVLGMIISQFANRMPVKVNTGDNYFMRNQ